MTLSLLRLTGTIVRYEWSAGNSGAAASGGTNQFLFVATSNGTPGASEVVAQRPAGVAFHMWRLGAAFTRTVPTSQATVTARINGISQGATATVIGTTLGTTVTDLAAYIAVVNTDKLSVLFVTTTTDTGTTHPCAQIIGCISDTF